MTIPRVLVRSVSCSLLSAHCPPAWTSSTWLSTSVSPSLFLEPTYYRHFSAAQRRCVSYRRFGESTSRPANALWAYQGNQGRQSSSGFSSFPRWVPYLVGFGGVWVILHLETVPETGRLRYMDTSQRFELYIGNQTYQETLQEYRHRILPTNHPTARYVERVARRIIAASGISSDENHDKLHDRKQVQWQVHVIDDPTTKNAFVVPGGKVFVFTGILPICANENGLAAVLGHETAHQILRHTAERISLMKVLFVMQALLAYSGLDFGLARALTSVFLQLPNSRTNEAEADHVGLNLMAKACFDPGEARKMWQRMDASEKGGSFDFLQTHPAHSKRIEKITGWLPEAERYREERCGFTTRSWDSFNLASRQPAFG